MITNQLNVDEFSEKIGTWEYNVENSFFTVSNDFLEIIEYSEAKLENIDDFFAMLSPSDQNIAIQSFSNTLDNNYPFSIELTIKAQMDKSCSLLWSGSVCEIKEGKNSRIIGLLQKQSAHPLDETENTVKVLQRRNEFIETILTNLPIGIAINDTTTGEASIVNDLFCKTYGWNNEDLIDISNFFIKVYPDENYRNQIMGQVMADIKSGDVKRMNWKGIQVTTNTGEKRVIDAKNIPVPNQNLMISTVVDVTTEFLQSKEIERVKKNQEALINSTNDFIWYIDLNYKIVTINESLKTYFKENLNREINESDSILIKELGDDYYQRWKGYYDKALLGSKYSINDINYNPITEKTEYRIVSFNPIYNSENELLGVSCYSKNNEKDALNVIQLQNTQNKLEKILDYSLDVICTIDQSGKFIQVSKAAKILWGYSSEELINTPFINYVLEEDRDKTNDIAAEIINGAEIKSFINRYVRKEGSVVEIEWSARWDAKEELIFCIARDTTEKSYNEKLEKLELKVYEEFSNPQNNLSTTLMNFIKRIEAIHPEMICSFLEIKDNKSYPLAHNVLLENLSNAIEGIQVGLNAGPCGTAAFIKEEVIVSDIFNDFRWKAYKDIALENNLKACWSIPILDSKNNVMVVFEVYFNTIKTPSFLETKTMRRTCKLLQIKFENETQRKQLLLSNQRYQYVTKVTFDAIWDWDVVEEKVFWGENYYSLFGEFKFEKDFTEFEKINKRIHPEDVEQISRQISEAIKSEESVWSFEHRYLKSDATYATVVNKAMIIRDANNRAFRVIGSMQDITKQKEELQRLRLMESVITNTKDAVLITEAEPFDEPGPRIIYVNQAFTKMTGYTLEDVVGKTPRILQGPKSDLKELEKLSEALRKWETCEITTINYKKNGEEFWINFSISPVANEKGWYTHWIAIERDVTLRKIEELEKALIAELSTVFNQNNKISESLVNALEKIATLESFDFGEIWLLNPYQNTVSLQAVFSEKTDKKSFYDFNKFTEFEKNDGLIWRCLETQKVQFSNEIQENSIYRRKEAAKKIGMQTVYAIPLIINEKTIGVMVLGSFQKQKLLKRHLTVFENLGHFIGKEIKRKQLENELNYMFDTAPDILCLISLDGYFKKVNPSASVLLEYDEAILLSKSYNNFIHPDDRDYSEEQLHQLNSHNPIVYFENRYVSKTNKMIWLAWTVTKDNEQNLFFGVAKDITQKKELEQLLDKANNLARIGGWELDIIQNKLFWSTITKEIHEVDIDFVPNVEAALLNYKEGPDRSQISESVDKAINSGEPFEHELQMLTSKGKQKWVRIICKSDIIDGKCIRLYGSFQDINDSKLAEMALRKAFEEKNTILESIGDAFYRVDRDWQVTYWNNKAEIILKKGKNEVLHKNLWDEFEDTIDSSLHHNYLKAFDENKSQHFEFYYDNLKIWFEVSAYPYDNGLSVYFRDITYRKTTEIKMEKLNENLQKRTKELEISNIELEQFAYVASHDLQEPLRMVTSFLTQIEKKYEDLLDERGKQYIFFAVDGAKRMRQIILDLLEFSRVGKQMEFNQSVDINQIVQEIQQIYLRDSTTMEIIIKNNLPIIMSQQSAIRQVFQNLIGNGIKYVAEGKNSIITIHYEDLIEAHKFTISDNGIGIDSQYFDKIFVIFQRLHQKDRYPGTGIGLAITKKIIESLGGKIGVDSKINHGSTFYFTVPKNN